MNPLFLAVALSTLAAPTGRITFRGAVVAPTCSYHHAADPRVVDAKDCHPGTPPLIDGPATDPATIALTGTSIPTWRLTYH